jgi:hypothetical protein
MVMASTVESDRPTFAFNFEKKKKKKKDDKIK